MTTFRLLPRFSAALKRLPARFTGLKIFLAGLTIDRQMGSACATYSARVWAWAEAAKTNTASSPATTPLVSPPFTSPLSTARGADSQASAARARRLGAGGPEQHLKPQPATRREASRFR